MLLIMKLAAHPNIIFKTHKKIELMEADIYYYKEDIQKKKNLPQKLLYQIDYPFQIVDLKVVDNFEQNLYLDSIKF